MIAPSLLAILCCPETHQPLAPAEPSLLAKLNEQIAAGTLRNCAGMPITRKLDEGLLRQDGRLLYPVRGSVPVMLAAEGIPLENPS